MGVKVEEKADVIDRTQETKLRMENFQRQQLSFDTPTYFHPEKPQVNACKNKNDYLANYGITFEIPSLYIQKATFWPQDHTYAIKSQFFKVPDPNEFGENDKQIFVHTLGGKREETTFDAYKFANQ